MSRFTHDGPGTPAASWAAAPQRARLPLLDVVDPAGSERPARVVVAAAHPDDESLGAGGLVASLRAAGVPVVLLLATAGERSHPRSPTVEPAELARRRLREAQDAWLELGGEPDHLDGWGLPDGELVDHHHELVRRLVAALGDARDTLLVTPWCHDGHPDHDALGRAGRVAAYRTGARLLQYPVWFWHRARPDEAPWSRMGRVAVDPRARAAKQRAIAAHASQVAPLSAAPGDETLLGPDLLSHFTGDDELFVLEPPADHALDHLHREHEDPWGTTTRWYERRKRDLLLALLPQRRFRRGFDVGCSTGALTVRLAERCDRVVALDSSPRALELAQGRLSQLPRVSVREAAAPHEWPEGEADLVVVSEAAYFLSPAALDGLARRIVGSLSDDGVVVLAHWCHLVDGWPLSGPEVHRRLTGAPGMPPVIATYRDRDVEILVLGAEDRLPDPSAT